MNDLIIGKNTILEVLKYKPLVILEIYTTKDKNDKTIQEIQKKNIPIKFVSKQKLSLMIKSKSHQNIIAKIISRKYFKLKDFLRIEEKKSKSLVVMLDGIFDPQNFGSILRTCECFSVDGVIFSKNRGTDITPIVTKAALGATELVKLIKASNLANCIDSFIDEGYSCIGTTLNENSKSVLSCDFSDKMLLIMGSEGKGIQKILLKKANKKIHIPMKGKLQSLNVSNALAVLLFYIKFVAK